MAAKRCARMSVAKRKVKLSDEQVLFGRYLNVEWRKIMRGVGDSAINLHLYKGKICVDIPYESKRASDYRKATGMTLAGTAWLDDKQIDNLISHLRVAKKIYRKHLAAVRRTVDCKDCKFAVCAKHRGVFHGWKRGKRGLL